jgi:hypothetical protein
MNMKIAGAFPALVTVLILAGLSFSPGQRFHGAWVNPRHAVGHDRVAGDWRAAGGDNRGLRLRERGKVKFGPWDKVVSE